tara:strand:- start:9016 stop:9387 length:372 start_codon:yes stop_codon:yes gene_type:complete
MNNDTITIDDRVKIMLKNKDWTFAELQNMTSVVEGFAEAIYAELSAKEKLDLVWEDIGQEFYSIASTKLKESVANAVRAELTTAKINFNKKEDNTNEVSESSVGGESSKTRSTNEKKSSKNKK